MKSITSQAIVLSRTNFAEADRIVTVLTPDHGKLRLMVKGARKIKSKLAGGIELFSISDITFIKGKSDLDTLVSSRPKQSFEQIAKDLDRTMLGYEILKKINKTTEDAAGEEYFVLLSKALEGLDDPAISMDIMELWFMSQLLAVTGHAPNLRTDDQGKPLSNDGRYEFDYESMSFHPSDNGLYTANHIKLLSLSARAKQPAIIVKVQNINRIVPELLLLVKNLTSQRIHS